MSGVVSSGCCCAEGCGDCCDFFSCSPTTPFTIELSGNWVSQETFSPSGQVITTGEIHWTITATMTRIGSDCSTYRYYANSCEFSYEYIKRRWSAGGAEAYLPASFTNPFVYCQKNYRFDLDGNGVYQGTFPATGFDLEWWNVDPYGHTCGRSACPCNGFGIYGPLNVDTGVCACQARDYCETYDPSDPLERCGSNSGTFKAVCANWNCTSFDSGFADQNACSGFGVKAAADIVLKVVEEKTWAWNATLQGRPATYCPPGSGNLCNTGLEGPGSFNCPNHQSYWVPGSVITIACTRNCNPDCDSPLLIFNPNPAQIVNGVYTIDLCMDPCAELTCQPEGMPPCSETYTVRLPFIDPWVIYGSGDCLNGDTFDEPITQRPCSNGSCGNDMPSVGIQLGVRVTNLQPPSVGFPGNYVGDPSCGSGLLPPCIPLNMCGIDQCCSLLDRTYVEKRVTYARDLFPEKGLNTDSTGHVFPPCCTREYGAHVESVECVYYDPNTSQYVSTMITEVVCDNELGVPTQTCPGWPEFTGTTDHTITWGFRFI